MDSCNSAEVFCFNTLPAASDTDGSDPKSPPDRFDYGTIFETDFNILIVDDEQLVARMLRRILKKYADNVYIAVTPADAMAVLGNHTISFLVCDFDLGPGVPDGSALVEASRARFSGIETAVIFSGEEPLQIPLSEGVDAVLQKNRDLERLCDEVQNAAKLYRARRL